MVKPILLLNLLLAFNATALAALADPTTPLNYQVNAVKKVTRSALPELQSILGEKGKRRAILDNKLYQQGQSIKGYRISHIKKESVLLSYQNKFYELNLYQDLKE